MRLRGLRMGIKGAAVATALNQACGAILYGVAGREGTAGQEGGDDEIEQQ